MGFVVMGFIGYFVKLVRIIANGPWHQRFVSTHDAFDGAVGPWLCGVSFSTFGGAKVVVVESN